MEGVLLGIRDSKNRTLKIRLGYQTKLLKQAINGGPWKEGSWEHGQKVICVNNLISSERNRENIGIQSRAIH